MANGTRLVGIVFECDETGKQYALSSSIINFNAWATDMFGMQIDMDIKNCPGCGKIHIIDVSWEKD